MAGLRDLGYVEGRNVALEYRAAEGNPQRIPALAREAVSSKPDLIVVLGGDLVRVVKEATNTIPVVMLTSYPDEDAVLSAIIAGASGYLLKQIRARDLVAALEAVGRGESLLDPAVTEKVLERVRRIATGGQSDELSTLTSQEQKILMLVAEGKTNKQIAAEVFLSDKTVKNYVSSILSKLNLERRAQAAATMRSANAATTSELVPSSMVSANSLRAADADGRRVQLGPSQRLRGQRPAPTISRWSAITAASAQRPRAEEYRRGSSA